MGIFDTNVYGQPTHFAQLTRRAVSSNVLSGLDPTEVDPSNPITLFIIQLVVILCFTQGLGWAFGYMKQPRVIAEIIGGIILGPTVMGRIPHFSEHIFPDASVTYLNLVSTIGLILFLFLVGVEVDIGVMKNHAKASGLISAAGMVLPFGVGAAVAVPVYHNFVDTENVSFGHFLLFVGVAMAITAFPVLCRILTSTKLIDTHVGVIVLAAGVGNDVVGWVLLALTLALVSAKSGTTAVYVLLCAVGWSIILLWPVKKAFRWIVKRTGGDEHGPTPGTMLLALMIVFISAFITDIIGVHPIFGGFIAGLIIPHDGGFAIAMVEKIDDLVSMLFLPIYFVLSGLQTNLGLLDSGHIWGYTILIIVVAFLGKFVGCCGAALALKYPPRESAAIGMLMSCKGLVELIVLNVGRSAGIIDSRLFSMFVVEAVVLTFITTPATLAVYPARFHKSLRDPSHGAGKKDDDKELSITGAAASGASGGREHTSKFLVILQKLEHLSAVMLLTQMLEPPAASQREPWDASGHVHGETKKGKQSSENGSETHDDSTSTGHGKHDTLHNLFHSNKDHPASSGLEPRIDALKLVELTGRTYSVMQSAEKDQLLGTDDALQLYRQFGRLRGLEITPHISIIEQEWYPQAVADYASDLSTELVIIPWTVPVQGGASSDLIQPATGSSSTAVSQFDSIFGSETAGSPMYTHFIRRCFAESKSDVALFVDRGFGGMAGFRPGSGQHVFLPFFGGPDDRLALRFVVQLCQHQGVTATIVRVEKDEEEEGDEAETEEGNNGEKSGVELHQAALHSNQLTVGGQTQYPETQARLQSETADSIAWNYYASPTVSPPRPAFVEKALERISFHSTTSHQPLTYAFTCGESAIRATSGGSKTWRPMLIVSGRGRRGAAINHETELTRVLAAKGLSPSIGAELRKTVGDAAAGMILGGGALGTASYLVMEAGKSSLLV